MSGKWKGRYETIWYTEKLWNQKWWERDNTQIFSRGDTKNPPRIYQSKSRKSETVWNTLEVTDWSRVKKRYVRSREAPSTKTPVRTVCTHRVRHIAEWEYEKRCKGSPQKSQWLWISEDIRYTPPPQEMNRYSTPLTLWSCSPWFEYHEWFAQGMTDTDCEFLIA